jgi:hypothetical protein
MEQRKTRRFTLQLPLAVTRTGTEATTFSGLTRNISSAGVLFIADKEHEPGNSIEYVITLNREGAHAVNLRCLGKVVRSERPSEEPGFQVAATLERYEFLRR